MKIDIIFVIYIYQRWIYRVDPNRTVIKFGKNKIIFFLRNMEKK